MTDIDGTSRRPRRHRRDERTGPPFRCGPRAEPSQRDAARHDTRRLLLPAAASQRARPAAPSRAETDPVVVASVSASLSGATMSRFASVVPRIGAPRWWADYKGHDLDRSLRPTWMARCARAHAPRAQGRRPVGRAGRRLRDEIREHGGVASAGEIARGASRPLNELLDHLEASSAQIRRIPLWRTKLA